MKNNVILPVLKRTPSKDAFLSLSHFAILNAIFSENDDTFRRNEIKDY